MPDVTVGLECLSTLAGVTFWTLGSAGAGGERYARPACGEGAVHGRLTGLGHVCKGGELTLRHCTCDSRAHCQAVPS